MGHYVMARQSRWGDGLRFREDVGIALMMVTVSDSCA